MSSTVWIDIEDLFAHANGGSTRPTGVQRFSFELCQALRALPEARGLVRFVRHSVGQIGLVEVPWAEVSAAFRQMASRPPAAPPPPEPEPRERSPGKLRLLARRRLPSGLRQPIGRYLALQWLALVALAELVAAPIRNRRRRRAEPDPLPAPAPQPPIGVPGDILLVPGAGWATPGQSEVVAWATTRGLRLALLVYDLIPFRRPDLCDAEHVRSFRAWLDSLLPHCDRIFAISHATAQDLRAHARTTRRPLAAVDVIPVGSALQPVAPVAEAPSRPLPAPGSYALFVSTLEARKNHALLVGIWRRLREQLPPSELPTLVFAGRVGWMVNDLMQQLQNSNWLDGHIMLFEGPTDAELAALYRGCRFTLFPSLYEGWGLPVTESLSFGKPCIASNSTSLPEAGGGMVRYFDPEDMAEATRVVRAVIEDRDGLRAWEERIRREFRPIAWSESAECLLRVLVAHANTVEA